MRVVRHFRVVVLVATTALVGACGSDSSVGPDRQPTDLGQVLTEMTLPSFAGVLAPELALVPSASVPVPSSCSFSAASQSFICPTSSSGGVTITQSFTLLNAAGSPQSQFDPATTAVVQTASALAGTFTSGGTTFTMDWKQDLAVSGLLTGKHLLNGISVLNVHGTDASHPQPFTFSLKTTITNLALPASSANKWPQSGVILVDLTDTVAGLPSTTHMRLSFNGTSKVAVVISTDGFSTSCTIDLASQSPSCS